MNKAQHNSAAIKMVTDRYSAHVQSFNHLPVSEADSDAQYWLNRELADLATAALTRAPLVKPSGSRRALMLGTDLGNVYRAVKQNLTTEERGRYDEIQVALESLSDKYSA